MPQSNGNQQSRIDEQNQSALDDAFVRNRFFNGKLMTARDMAAEQDYHAGRLETLTRFVTGAGVVCGLGLRVETPPGEDGPPQLIVESGLAIDGLGRPIVVPDDDDPTPLTGEYRDPSEALSVYLSADACLTESVPAHGSEDACNDDCEYNRVRETYAVEIELGPPDSVKPLDVRDSAHPTEADLQTGLMTDSGPANGNDALHRFARSYHETGADSAFTDIDGCGSSNPERIFLGQLTVDDEGNWQAVDPTDDGFEPRPYVYTNDLLYTGLVDHATDFANPHELALWVGAGDPGAMVGLEDGNAVSIRGAGGTTVTAEEETIVVESEQAADLSVSPTDGGARISIGDGDPISVIGGANTTIDPGGDTITISSEGGIDDLDPLAEYRLGESYREDVLLELACELEALADRVERDGTKAAGLARTIANGVREMTTGESAVVEDGGEFVDYVTTDVLPQLRRLLELLEEYVGGRERFESVLGEIDAEDPLAVAIDLDRVVDAIDCLTATAVSFDQLRPRTTVTSPLTIEDVVFDPWCPELPMLWGYVPRIVATEGSGQVLEFLQEGLRIDVEPTHYATVTVRNGEWMGLSALDKAGTEVDSDSATVGRGSTAALTVETDPDDPPITALELTIDGGTPPTKLDSRGRAEELLTDAQLGVLKKQSGTQTAQLVALRAR